MHNLLTKIVEDNSLHAKWLNTLSFMENMGARKISASEHHEKVSLLQLKHAAEEHRHAYYLKKQILKVSDTIAKNYYQNDLLAATYTKQYLQRLDIQSSRLIKQQFGLKADELRYASYLFVTYAIEVRADALYPVYQSVLTEKKSPVMVKSIILEEEGHLEEMIAQLNDFHPDWKLYADQILALENQLFKDWLQAIQSEVLGNVS